VDPVPIVPVATPDIVDSAIAELIVFPGTIVPVGPVIILVAAGTMDTVGMLVAGFSCEGLDCTIVTAVDTCGGTYVDGGGVVIGDASVVELAMQ
jgi:hypothetical protein